MDTKNSAAVPAAIVIAGIVIAGAIVYSIGKSGSQPAPDNGEAQVAASLDKMRPVDATDHVRGAGAPLTLVEYTDPECPFCKRFHETMQQVMKEYPGKIAWVYRNFPLKELHSKAPNESAALECAGKLGGNDIFWQYTDALYAATPSNNGLDPAELPKIAANLKLDATAFANCLKNGDTVKKVESDAADAMATGGNGTPWSILVTKDGKKYPVNGAQPIENLRQLIDTALKS